MTLDSKNRFQSTNTLIQLCRFCLFIATNRKSLMKIFGFNRNIFYFQTKTNVSYDNYSVNHNDCGWIRLSFHFTQPIFTYMLAPFYFPRGAKVSIYGHDYYFIFQWTSSLGASRHIVFHILSNEMNVCAHLSVSRL